MNPWRGLKKLPFLSCRRPVILWPAAALIARTAGNTGPKLTKQNRAGPCRAAWLRLSQRAPGAGYCWEQKAPHCVGQRP